MKKVCAIVLVVCFFSACFSTGKEVPQQQTVIRESDVDIGYVWMMPLRTTFEELLTNTDQWRETRAVIDVIGYADHDLVRNYSDDVLRAGFAVLNELGLPLALEVGAVKEWGTTGQGTFYAQQPMWEKFIDLGATIVGIVMDEPLVAVHAHPQFNHIRGDAAKLEYAAEETAEFMRLVREDYPDWFIACIEVFPHFSANYMIRFINTLEEKLAEKGVRGQDFFRLDVNWAAFQHFSMPWLDGWRQARRIEDHCRSIGLPFSQIYWASDIPRDPGGWLNSILRMGQGYRDAGGRPDQYVIQSWLNNENIPENALPETDPHSFTYSVLEFNRQFIPR